MTAINETAWRPGYDIAWRDGMRCAIDTLGRLRNRDRPAPANDGVRDALNARDDDILDALGCAVAEGPPPAAEPNAAPDDNPRRTELISAVYAALALTTDCRAVAVYPQDLRAIAEAVADRLLELDAAIFAALPAAGDTP